MNFLLGFLTTAVVVASVDNSCADFNDQDSKWEQINHKARYFRIAANMMSDTVWALSQNKRHRFKSGHILVYYEQEQKRWVKDKT
jgi:hypothetical protein